MEDGRSDLAEAEAIAAGTTRLLAEKRHVVALFLALQRARVKNEHLDDCLVAYSEDRARQIESEAQTV